METGPSSKRVKLTTAESRDAFILQQRYAPADRQRDLLDVGCVDYISPTDMIQDGVHMWVSSTGNDDVSV